MISRTRSGSSLIESTPGRRLIPTPADDEQDRVGDLRELGDDQQRDGRDQDEGECELGVHSPKYRGGASRTPPRYDR